jgi:hypothetical protein
MRLTAANFLTCLALPIVVLVVDGVGDNEGRKEQM